MRQVTLSHIETLRAGTEIRAHDLTTAISLDVILRTVFGMDGDALVEGRSVVRAVLHQASPLLMFARPFQRPWFPPWRELQRAKAAYDAMIARIVVERRKSGLHGEDILGMLLDARWDDGSEMTIAEIRDQLLTLLVAGHETTAISLAWAIYDVYRDRAIVRRLREEIDALGPGPEPESIARLPYLSAVCDETLRMRPIITDVARTLVSPMEFGGYMIPAGASVGVAIELIHQDETIYPHPDQFRPERFLDKKPGPFEFLPFGGGHRRCLGAAFSDYEARLVLATVVSRFDLEPRREDRRSRRNVTMGPKHGVMVRVARRIDFSR
jgi:cytochrome P450